MMQWGDELPHGLWWGAAARLLWLLLTVALLIGAGCGLKTAPRPSEKGLPLPEGFQGRPRPEEALLSWLPPSQANVERYGKPLGYRLQIHRLPQFCAGCPPEEKRKIDLPAQGPELHPVGKRLFYILPLRKDQGLLRIQLRIRYLSGFTAASRPVLMEAVRRVPEPRLEWKWANPNADPSKPRAMLFSWKGVSERFEWVVAKDGSTVEQELYYKANLYRREPPQPWPLTPLNPHTLPGPSWLLPPLEAALPEQGRVEEYVLRFVSLDGKEGPPSDTVVIRIPSRGP